MKKENQNFYDVFISYRRVGGRDVARILQLQLVQRGLHCFFDFDELQNGDFNEAIYDAIDRSKNFIVVLSNGALERCINEGDWVRREIECALEKKINVVPVAPSDAPRAYPAKLPPSLECLRKLQIAPLNMEDLLEESVDKIIRRSLKGVDYDLKSGRVKGFSGSASEVMELQLDLPKLGKRIEDADLAKLSDGDKDRFKKAVRMYRNLRFRSALAEFRKIRNQDDPIVKYYVLRIAYEFEPVDDAEFDQACIVARDLGCTDAMIVFAARNLNAASEFSDVSYKVCIDWFCKAIAGGNAYAYVNLGNAYSEGKGVGKDKRIARLLYQKSAEEKCLPGVIALGMDYVGGDNGKKDVQAAKRILRPVIRHLQEYERELCGSDVAGLAILMLTGEVMDRNLDKFRECADALQHSKGNDAERYFDYVCIGHWLSAIALQIDVDTATDEEKRNAFKGLVKSVEKRNKFQDTIRVLLGRFYENGIGTEVDLGKAVECYRTAADNGDADGMEALAAVYLQDGPYKDVEKARTLLEDAAAEENPSSQYLLGLFCLGDAFGQPDNTKAMDLLSKAAAGGSGDAMDQLGQCCRDGTGGTAIDYSKAVEWFKRGVEAGCTDSLENLAMAYLFGQGVQENRLEAERLLVKGAEQGNASAACSLGTRYYNGDFGYVDHEKALSWWAKAANGGDATAMMNLGKVYQDGSAGLKQDNEQAVKWFEKARDAGEDSALNALGAVYYSGEDKARAFALQLEAAKRGDVGGMYNVAGLYRDGEGVEQSPTEACAWFKKAAEAGHPDAMVQLGFAYLNGTGVDENKTESETWFVKAAETGDVDAENTLGVRYYNGDFGKEDFAKALKWIRKAANDGNPRAMNNLGEMYRDGDAGLAADDKQAVKWFRKAAAMSFPDAMTNLGFAYLYGKGVVENVSRAEEWFVKGAETGAADAECSLGTRCYEGVFGAKDVSKAMTWWLKAAEHGDPIAMGNLARCYRDGDGGEKDMGKAEEWYLKAADAGNADATCSLAMCYYRGDFGRVDKTKAYEWSLKAAEQGDGMAMYNLGRMYQDGDGAQKDMGRALSWFCKAADKGVASAMRDLGLVYLLGDGVQVDTNEAERWLVKAAESEDAESECCLGTLYEEGAFGKRDCTRAIEWWRKAADHGDRDALSNLGRIYMDGAEGVEKDVRKGITYLKQAAEAGNSFAMERLGIAYMRGEGVVVDETMAKEWMSKAVDAGNARAEYGLGCWLLKGELGEKDVQGAIKMFEGAAASHEYPFAFVALGYVFSNPKSAEAGVPVDLDRARDCFKKADEAGVDSASAYLGLDVLGLLGKELESYDDVAKTLAENPLEDSERSRIFRKARSWFNKPIVNECEDDEVLGSCLRWLARLARYEQRDAEAVELYRKAVEKGDEQAKRELTEVEPASRGKDVMMKDETVMPPVAAPAVVQDKTVAEPLGDLTRAELVFLRKARRFKANDGRIDAEEKKELKDVAVELGIDPVRREELIEQVEDEYIQAGK